MSKKVISLMAVVIICMLIAVVLGGCGGTKNDKTAAQPAKQQNIVTAGLKTAEFEQPMLITSVGQSADAQMVKALAERSGLKYTYKSMAKPEDFGNVKTLVLVIGGSSKGMGAAGVNLAQEEQRGKKLVAEAKKKNLKLIVMHVGGEARLGELTSRFIPLVSEGNYAIVVKDGDKNKEFSKAVGSKIPIDFPATISDVAKYLKAAFK